MTALILVDLQNDFFPGGSLAVPDGNQVLPTVNALLQLPFDFIVATQDWHPANHCSFAVNHRLPIGSVIDLDGIRQVLWPMHCVQNTPGAAFAEGWDRRKVQKIIHKGTDAKVDSYSAFFDNREESSTGLGETLKNRRIHTVVIAGLATDYCVKYSTLDALRLGFKVLVVPEGCRGVDIHPDDCVKALEEIKDAGAELATLTQVSQYLSSQVS
jgi:nicotinamidase/pyrazinamidase